MRSPRFSPWLVAVTLAAVGAAAMLGYGLTAPKRYEATAQLLVLPVSASDSTFAGLDVLRDASGRRTAAASAAELLHSAQIADAVRTQLGLRRSVSSLLDEVHAHVAGSSDVVDVTVEETSGVAAAQIANAFADALVAQRTVSFQSQLGSLIGRDEQLLRTKPDAAQAAELSRRLAVLRAFQGQPDPTLRRASQATAPSHASWPDVPRLVALGAGGGLAAGTLLAGLLLLRRRESSYDPFVPAAASGDSGEALAQLLERRLAARESALAMRERELQAKIDELRALEPTPARPAADHSVLEELERREAALAERERLLAERIAVVTRREIAVARRAAASAPSPPEPEAAPKPPAPAPAPVAAPVAPPEPAAGDAGAFNLTQLEHLVGTLGAAHPDRLEEWESYLYFLRDYAAADGRLPASFDWLVTDTFREILA